RDCVDGGNGYGIGDGRKDGERGELALTRFAPFAARGLEFLRAGAEGLGGVEVLVDGGRIDFEDSNAIEGAADDLASCRCGQKFVAKAGGENNRMAEGATVTGHGDFFGALASQESTDKLANGLGGEERVVDGIEKEGATVRDVR